MSYAYPIKYSLEKGAFTKEQLEESTAGGCDNIAIISIVGEFGEGPISMAVLSAYGKKDQPWTGTDMFKAWTMLAKQLADDEKLSPARRELASLVFEAVRAAILASRDNATVN